MKRTSTTAAAVAAAAGGLLVATVLPVAAAPAPGPTPAPRAPGVQAPAGEVPVGEEATEPVRILTLGAAQRLASEALRECARRGAQVTVTVVDRGGVELVTLRDEDATGATVQVAQAKAFAASAFRLATAQLQEAARTTPGIETLPGFVVLPGGQPITRGTTLLGGIGVSGAPTGEIDDACIDAAERVVD